MINRQKGLSLIELLIAIALSSILILGVTQIFIDNKRNQVFQANQIGNLENARFAELMLNNLLGKAGYRRTPDILLETAFPRRAADSTCSEFEAGAIVTSSIDNGLCLRYQPLASGETVCTGQASATFDDQLAFTSPPSSNLIVLAIKYEPGSDASRPENGSLQCRDVSNVNSEFIELVSNVAGFSLVFGYGPDDMMDKHIESFDPSGNGTIRAVRYAALLASRSGQRDTGESPTLRRWLDDFNGDTNLSSSDNKRIYQIAQSTQTLRNYMP